MPEVGVALSGGGHRASAFGLGTLLYLADARKNRDVTTISSVSGGSITNAFVGLRCNFESTNSVEFRKAMQPLAYRIAISGTLWAWWGTWLYLAVMLAAFACCFIPFFLMEHTGLAWISFVACILIWAWLFLAQRGRVCGKAFRATVFDADHKSPQLRDLSARHVDHVLCATDLQTAEHVYFSGRFVYSYAFGVGSDGNLPLHVAIQASASFPGGFPVRWLLTKRFHFMHAARPQDAGKARYLSLIDGGVYDNMGEQWLMGAKSRADRFKKHGIPIEFAAPKEIIIVNSSSNFGFLSTWKLRIPILTEILTLKRVSDVMYDNTTAPRRRYLNALFEKQEFSGTMVIGLLLKT